MDSGERLKIEKYDVKLKTNSKDGVIIQLHHTIRDNHGKTRRIRFVTASFNDENEHIACADAVGNIFMLDFFNAKFWKIANAGPPSCIIFSPFHLETLIAASAINDYKLVFINTETGNSSIELSGHSAPVKSICFSSPKTRCLLSVSPLEAILWELQYYTKKFILNAYNGSNIQQMIFLPVCDSLIACFQNDTIQIWRDTLQPVKQIVPSELKHLKSLAVTLNGRALVMAGLSSKLIVLSMDTWKPIKTIDLAKFDISGAKQVAFIPQSFDGGCNKILAVLSSQCQLYIFDIDSGSLLHSIVNSNSNIKKIVVSPTGKYFQCIFQMGEICVYNASHVLDKILINKQSNLKSVPSSSERPVEKAEENSLELHSSHRLCLDSARLRRILLQYGEYPEKFRSNIWKSLLKTPKNQSAYISLVDKGVHSAYKDIEKHFTIHSTATLKNLKRLLSCLTNWCPLFGVLKFLPGFVFPFVRVMQKDPLLLFECVATILINYCQLWFEYSPFPPINILAMVENVLAYHDPELLEYYCSIGVTSQVYALIILETAFSEILTGPEWLVLWDHILSNEPAFIYMAVVAYNIIQRIPIKKLNSDTDVELFFHMQNPVSKKTLIKKCYVLLNETPEDIHPRRFLNAFSPLEKGDNYQQFSGYPRATICLKIPQQRKKLNKAYTLQEIAGKSLQTELENRVKSQEFESDYSSRDSDDRDDVDGKISSSRLNDNSYDDRGKRIAVVNLSSVRKEDGRISSSEAKNLIKEILLQSRCQ